MVIDIYSKGEYPANILSNFYANKFTFDGVECASMEGFLQALKFKNKKRQYKVCHLTGKEAKKVGQRKFLWKITGNVYWQGKRFKRNSKEFDELRLNAYESLLNNSVFYEALLSSSGYTLTHSIGGHDKHKTILTEKEFIHYLEILRAKQQ